MNEEGTFNLAKHISVCIIMYKLYQVLYHCIMNKIMVDSKQ